MPRAEQRDEDLTIRIKGFSICDSLGMMKHTGRFVKSSLYSSTEEAKTPDL